MLKLSAGLLILFIAFLLQFFFSTVGVFVNLSFAALIAFAFVFEFWEVLLFIAITVFIVNWQPMASPEIIVTAIFPIAAYLSRDIFRWKGWLMNAIAIFIGFLVLALVAAPAALAAHWQPFLVDVVAGELFGVLIFLPLYRIGRR